MAENNYENYYSSETYGNEDVTGGGEQIETALYFNEQLAVVNDRVEKKQNKVILQPTEPPANPSIGDMWIDNNVFPNIIYTWDGSIWQKATATSAEEVGTYTTAQVDEQLSGVNMNLEATASRTTVIEETLTDGEGLASTVTSTETYDKSVKTIAAGEIKSAIDNLNLTQYATSSQLEQLAKSITAKLSSSGGVNILKNSVGYATLANWQVTAGTVNVQQGSDMVDAGSGFVIADGVVKQAVGVLAGEHYTLTCKVKKGTAGDAYMKLSDGQVFQQVNVIATQSYNYDLIQIAGFVPTTGVLIVELGGTGVTGGCIFTALMLNVGDVGLQWSNAMGEMYNTNVRFDLNGVEVKSSVYDGYTIMSPQEFSGYARNSQGVMEKVFTLNKDTTEMTKAAIDQEMAMGTIKAVYINGGGYRGWSFIPSD